MRAVVTDKRNGDCRITNQGSTLPARSTIIRIENAEVVPRSGTEQDECFLVPLPASRNMGAGAVPRIRRRPAPGRNAIRSCEKQRFAVAAPVLVRRAVEERIEHPGRRFQELHRSRILPRLSISLVVSGSPALLERPASGCASCCRSR